MLKQRVIQGPVSDKFSEPVCLFYVVCLKWSLLSK